MLFRSRAIPSAAQRRLDVRVGQELWDESLTDWQNLKVVTCGHHFAGAGFKILNGGYADVLAFHVNYQNAIRCPVRMVSFLDNGRILVWTYDPCLEQEWPRTTYPENFSLLDNELWQLPSQI